MAKREDDRRGTDASPPADERADKKGSSAVPSESAFDLWLNRGLHQIFDEVAQEPLPEELLRLIEQDRKS